MAAVRKRTWKTATGEAKAAWVVDYTDSRGDRQRKHFLNKKCQSGRGDTRSMSVGGPRPVRQSRENGLSVAASNHWPVQPG